MLKFLRKTSSEQREGAGLFALALLITGLLLWPLPLHLTSSHILSAFGDSHVWAFDQMVRMMTGDLPFSTSTYYAGYPRLRDARFIGWTPALMSLPFRPLLGPLGAFNLVMWASPGLAALACWRLVRRFTPVRGLTSWGPALIYAFCPYGLALLGNGNIEKGQYWCYPLYLLWLDRAILGPRRGLALGLVGLVAFLMTFSDPYFGLLMPVVAVPFALLRSGLGRLPESNQPVRIPPRLMTVTCAGLALLLTAAAIYPARPYYKPHEQRTTEALFRPADDRAKTLGFIIPGQSPVAQPAHLLFGSGHRVSDVYETIHSNYLVLPVLLLALLGAAIQLVSRGRGGGHRRGQAGPPPPGDGGAPTLQMLTASLEGHETRPHARAGLGVGLGLLAGGVLMAMGPRLAMNDTWMSYAGRPYALPMAWLESLGYPLVAGGQYYRAIPLASLGLAVLIATTMAGASAWLDARASRASAPASARRSAWVAALSVLLGLLAIADGVRDTGPYWPRPVVKLEGLPLLSFLAGNPADGAVLTLPLATHQAEGGRQLLLATFHGRPTNPQPRHFQMDMLIDANPWLKGWSQLLQETPEDHRAEAAQKYMMDQGFRYIVQVGPLEPLDEQYQLTPTTLTSLFGTAAEAFSLRREPTGRVDPGVRVWEIGQTQLHPVP